MQLLYFGWVKTRIGKGRESLDPPAEIADVRTLVEWLKQRGDGYQSALEDLTAIRVAVNQEMTDLDAPITVGDEVALFPPMTGG
ncbi:MAG: molybdopterin converting factor subunit 1 [Rhodospirillaceae bacterium]|nr:molybdopterin converting factor subunit 1 [Rhodospirillaceae bacterium]|tara:strand:+ start:4049 stop:4300 length:252 start_codon:yes stop_codon:yes gene_type:complete